MQLAQNGWGSAAKHCLCPDLGWIPWDAEVPAPPHTPAQSRAVAGIKLNLKPS